MSQPKNQPGSNQLPPAVALLNLITASWVSQAIYAAAKLGLADFLKDGPRYSDELARATGVHAPSLYRLLRALASVGVFVEVEDRRFALTPLAALLQSGTADSMRALAIMVGEEFHYRPWGELLYSVKTGETAFAHVFGMEAFPYLDGHPEAARIFNQAMTSASAVDNAAITAAYDFSSFSRVVDVAGGHGSLMAAILKANPELKGILFDQPQVIEGARGQLQAAGVGERCELVAGDFFESAPGGGDAYLLKHILHDWDDERAIRILQNIHRAMKPAARLLVIEQVIQPGNEPHFGKLLDLEMLVLAGGRERTEAEYRELLTAAGFTLQRIIPTNSTKSVIEGVRIES